jgi:uncharacterized protein YjbI with pentapeptide repeats
MFEYKPCAAGCGNSALSGSELCALHSADSTAEASRIVGYMLGGGQVHSLNAAYLKYQNIVFTRHEFYGCNFENSEFISCTFTECNMRLDFFDFATFTDCKFIKSDMRSVSFGGAIFERCSFEDSELLHLNFCGASIKDTIFCHSNLYNSRFNNAKIGKIGNMEPLNNAAGESNALAEAGSGVTGFEINDCNVKKVFFINVKQSDIKFRSSNTAEAIFFMES